MIPSDPSRPPLSPQTLLVFASVPPPVHGQNLMVAAMLAHLRSDPNFRVIHIDPQLSRTTAEVGRGSLGKFFRLLRACARVWIARAKQGPLTLYYVPAPGKRVPVLRDWIALSLCRPAARKTIFHWHAVGLGAWARSNRSRWSRRMCHHVFDRADLSIVLAPELAEDAQEFRPKQIRVVPNGIPEPRFSSETESNPPVWKNASVFRVLFLGLGNESKGLFRTIEAVAAANHHRPGGFQLTFAGNFESPADEQRFRAAEAKNPEAFQWVGFADETAKARWYKTADVLCFPTQYPHEGQPLVILEALAHDLPIIASRWRSIPGLLPSQQTWLVEPDQAAALVEALLAARSSPREAGVLRQHYETRFTLATHLRVLKEALQSV